MADVKVRNLPDDIAAALKARASARGISLEEEVRRTLANSVAARRDAFVRRAAACRRASHGKSRRRASDSTEIIREERDAWG